MNENIVNLKHRNYLRTVLLDQWEVFWQQDVGIEREQLTTLKQALTLPHAVVISGLRRVGKSTLLSQFGHRLGQNQFYFINFEDERLLKAESQDFELMHSVLIELFGEKKIFLLDEIQNLSRWENVIRRLIDQGYKFYLTGSNASLLSRELGTKLTGRYLPLELYPFSFREFLLFKRCKVPKLTRLTTRDKNRLIRFFKDYLSSGGIPDSLKYPKLALHQTLYDDVLYRDIATRYQITETKALKELTFYLISNVGHLISFNKLKESLRLGSVNTIKSYIEHLENSWLLFVITVYAYSVKKQQIAPKKIYAVDTGLIRKVSFSFSQNYGQLLENLVFLHLRKVYPSIYYYRTKRNLEVDFYLPQKQLLIQVAQSLDDQKTREREIDALCEAAAELKISRCLILTETEKEIVKEGKLTIKVNSIYEWLLEPSFHSLT